MCVCREGCAHGTASVSVCARVCTSHTCTQDTSVCGTPAHLLVCECAEQFCVQRTVCLCMFCAGSVCTGPGVSVSVCVCVSVCGQITVHGALSESSYVGKQIRIHRILCVCECVCASACGLSAGVGSQEAGGTLLRKSTHKDLVGWAFLPASLPRLKQHSDLAPQAGAGGRASAHAGHPRKGSPVGVTTMSLPSPAPQDRLQLCPGTF